MNILLVGYKIFKEIISQKHSLNFVLDIYKTRYNFSNEDYHLLVKTLQGSIRHFYLLAYQVGTLFKDLSEEDDETYLLVLAIYQIKFMKKQISLNLIIDNTIEVNNMFLLRLKDQEIVEKFNKVSNEKFKFDTNVITDVYKYNSLMFSTPSWIIKMWSNQYGDDIMLSLLHSKNMKHDNFVHVNTTNKKSKDIISNPIYCSTNLGNCFIYKGDLPLSNLEDAKNGYVFVEDYSSQLLSNQIQFYKNSHILLLHCQTSSFSCDIANKVWNLNSTVDANFENDILYRKAKYQFQRLSIKNARAYLGDNNSLRTYLPYNYYDLVICSPISSCLGLINKKTSLLLTLTKEDIKEYIKEQKLYLEEADKYLKSNYGCIVYMVNTINMNESNNITKEFLIKHNEYVLKEEKQIFPYEYNSDGLYYAILTKGDYF